VTREITANRSESLALKKHWQAQREHASTPAYRIEDLPSGEAYVMVGEERVAGPFSNAEAWRWIDRNERRARRYGEPA
jgi:hypothetical protein